MNEFIISISWLIATSAALGGVLFLHRIAKPLGHALMTLSLNTAGRRLDRLVNLAKGRATLLESDSQSRD
jgi:hypothetical protein